MRHSHFRTLLMSLAAAALSLAVTVPPAGAETQAPVAIAAQDTLMIRVGQWNALETVYQVWPGVSGEYTVATDGTISVPMAGTVTAAGVPVEAIAQDITARLISKLGTSSLVTVSVEVLEYRPIYVLGKVRDPGPYPFVPGLTVLQALSLASGIGIEDAVELGATRRALNALGQYEVLSLELMKNQASLLRLRAELEDRTDIATPVEMADQPQLVELLDLEREILKSRNTAHQASLEQIASLKVLLGRQIEVLTEQIALVESQIAINEEELSNIDTLVEKGLALAARRGDLATTRADLASEKLDLETARLEAELKLNTADRERLDLVNERRRLLIEELVATQSDLLEIDAQMRLMSALYSEANLAASPTDLANLDEPVFHITRKTAAGYETVEATRDTPMEPLDVLEVELPLLATEGLGAGSAQSLLEGFKIPQDPG